MSGATQAFTRKLMSESNSKTACHGRARQAAVATTSAGQFTGWVTEPIRPSVGTAALPRNHGRSAPRQEDHP